MIRIQKFLHAKYINMSKNFFKEKNQKLNYFISHSHILRKTSIQFQPSYEIRQIFTSFASNKKKKNTSTLDTTHSSHSLKPLNSQITKNCTLVDFCQILSLL